MKNTWKKIAALALVCMLSAGMGWTALADEMPVEEPQYEDVIVEETPVEETPVEEEPAPAAEAIEPVEEATEPAAETPVEEPVAEETIEEEPVEEEVVEEVTEEAEEEPVTETEEAPAVEEETVDAAEEQTEVEIDYSALQVIVQTNFENVIMPGDVIELEGILIGFEGLEYIVQWQYDDGSGWQDMEGATELTYSFAANEENLNYQWRLMVTL